MSSDRRAELLARLEGMQSLVARVEAGETAGAPFGPEDIGSCTATAEWLSDIPGGQRVGWFADDNRGASIGALEGGHDIALIDGRWILDWWATEYATEAGHPGLLDLERPHDAVLARRWYGDSKTWESNNAPG
jgi:hypothetical protein